MAHMTNVEFLKMASSHLNKTYSGDPLCLETFIDSLNLLNGLATSTELRTFFVAFIKTKLDGRAREFITADHNTVALIIDTLRRNIKPDNAKVIEGRMLALRFTTNTQNEFSDKVEELADAFRRSLIVEGIPPTKASEMVVDKTVELCRKNTHSDLIKSVLESSTFNSPKDVVAKLVTQVDKTKAEAQILSFHTNRRNRGNRFGGNRQNYNHNNRYNDNGNRSNGHYGGNHENGNSHNRNGNYRGRRRGYINRGRCNYGNNANRQNNNNNPSNIRVMQENSQTPQQGLGASNNI